MTPTACQMYTAHMTERSGPETRSQGGNILFQIQIQGQISPERAAYFAGQGLESSLITAGEPATMLTGEILDQSHRRGLLNKIWDLNFEVILVRKIRQYQPTGGSSDE